MVKISEGGDRPVSTLGHTLKPQALHRLEVITGTGRRRRFSDDAKARIIEGTLVPGAVVSEIARRHGYRRNSCLAGAAKARQPASASSAGSFFVQTFFACLLSRVRMLFHHEICRSEDDI
jgi:transposase